MVDTFTHNGFEYRLPDWVEWFSRLSAIEEIIKNGVEWTMGGRFGKEAYPFRGA